MAEAAKYERSGALISDDKRYRYALWRQWDGALRTMHIIGLNPSTADAEQDDPTIRRCVGFAKREGCGRLLMLNLFALRATKPKVMRAGDAPVGPLNDMTLRDFAKQGGLFVAAWGAHGSHLNRAREVRNLFASEGVRLHCLGFTASGAPRHPLYLKSDEPLIEYAA